MTKDEDIKFTFFNKHLIFSLFWFEETTSTPMLYQDDWFNVQFQKINKIIKIWFVLENCLEIGIEYSVTKYHLPKVVCFTLYDK